MISLYTDTHGFNTDLYVLTLLFRNSSEVVHLIIMHKVNPLALELNV